MLGFSVLHAQQPPHRRKVIEVVVDNWVGRFFQRRNWAGVTVPLFGVAFIFYWVLPGEQPKPRNRVHEWCHVRQWERPGPFYFQYLWGMIFGGGYYANELEVEAYEKQWFAEEYGMPSWADPRSNLKR